MWDYKVMLKIKSQDRITNEKVINKIREKRTFCKDLSKKRAQMVGHTLKHKGSKRYILEGKIGKKRGGLRQTNLWTDDFITNITNIYIAKQRSSTLLMS